MTLTKNIRIQMGISQTAFADLLDCSLGQLAMHETGKRSLPAKSVAALALLEQALAISTAAPANLTVQATPATDRMLRRTRLLLEKTKHRIATLEEKIQQCHLLLHLADSWHNTLPLAPGESAARMKILERQAQKKLGRYRQVWLKQQVQLAGLDAQIERAGLLLSSKS